MVIEHTYLSKNSIDVELTVFGDCQSLASVIIK